MVEVKVEIVTVPERIEAARDVASPGMTRADAPGRRALVDPQGTAITLVAGH